jgi:formate dehydrogenase subunit delta
MDNENLVKMANQIADFFDAGPDPAQAVKGIGEHILRFWEPRMRRSVLAHLAVHPADSGLHPSVEQALRTLVAPKTP